MRDWFGKIKRNPIPFWGMIAAIFVIGSWLYVACSFGIDIFHKRSPQENLNWRGTFGDTFGSINSLFSGLSLIGIVIAIVFQHQELRITKEALEDEKIDRRNSKLEETLFNLIKLHQDSESNICINYSGINYYGKAAFDKMYETVVVNQIEKYEKISEIENETRKFTSKFSSQINQYTVSLFLAVNYTKNVKNKKLYEFYKKIIITQISPNQRLILALIGFENKDVNMAASDLNILYGYRSDAKLYKHISAKYSPEIFGIKQ